MSERKDGRRTTQKNKNKEFSKVIMKMEMRLLWINTLGVLGLAYYCVYMVSLPWAAWGVSKTGYTMKSVKENTSGGIVYDSAMREEGGKNGV